MIDVLSTRPAVLATEAVSHEDASAGDGTVAALWRLDVVAQPNDRWKLKTLASRAHETSGTVDDIGSFIENEYSRSALGDYRQRFIRCVEYQRPSHGRPYRAPVGGLVGITGEGVLWADLLWPDPSPRNERHQSSHTSTSCSVGTAVLVPVDVTLRNSR